MNGSTNAQHSPLVIQNIAHGTLPTTSPEFLTQIVIPRTGYYLITGWVQFTPMPGGYLLIGATTQNVPGNSIWYINIPILGSDYQRGSFTEILPLAKNSILSLAVYQTSGSSATVDGTLKVIWLSDVS